MCVNESEGTYVNTVFYSGETALSKNIHLKSFHLFHFCLMSMVPTTRTYKAFSNIQYICIKCERVGLQPQRIKENNS